MMLRAIAACALCWVWVHFNLCDTPGFGTALLGSLGVWREPNDIGFCFLGLRAQFTVCSGGGGKGRTKLPRDPPEVRLQRGPRGGLGSPVSARARDMLRRVVRVIFGVLALACP